MVRGAVAPQQGSRHEFDVLVLGAGIAGLSCVLHLIGERPETRVALVAKKTLRDSNSRYAQGGIAAVAAVDDTVGQHIADTIDAGDGLCNRPAVESLLSGAATSIADLEQWGVRFDTTGDGDGHDLNLEGGHSRRRVHHAADRTGEVIVDALIARVREHPSVTVLENHTAVNLIVQGARHAPGASGEVLGVYSLDDQTERVDTLLARATVLATGGAGKVYRYTTNPDVSTGDGVAMAYRAGARIGNLEFYQFHPTLLFHPAVNNLLISEALRGEGAYLRLPGTEERFMERYEPEHKELATRDKVARAIFTEMERHSLDHVYLDVRHMNAEHLRRRFPMIHETLAGLGIDMSRGLIPVVPAAHYMCGGVLADVDGRTDLGRLFAIGEVAFTGFHGANRLASNSLIEGAVMGNNAAHAVLESLEHPMERRREILDWDSQCVADRRRASQISAHWRGLRSEMTSYAGIVRTEAGLQDLCRLVAMRRELIEDYYWTHSLNRDFIELRNIALVAELIARSALHRRESRGGHYREDYKEQVPDTRDTVLRFQQEFPRHSQRFERPQA